MCLATRSLFPCGLVLVAALLGTPLPISAQVWEEARSGGGTGSEHGFDVAVSATGEVYATGGFFGTATFGAFTLTSGGGQDVSVVKYGPTGDVLWARQAGGPGVEDRGRGVVVDDAGNVYVAGGFYETADFGAFTLTSAGSRDIFLAKYSPEGEVLWARRAGGTQDDFGLFVSLDGAGNPFVSGRFQLTADFGAFALTSAGGNDVFLAKYAPEGEVLWAHRGGSPSAGFFELGLYTVTDAAGNTHLTGRFEQTADFGPFSLTSAGLGDVFLVTYDPEGEVLRALRAGGPGDDFGHGVAVDAAEGLYVTGWFSGTADFGGLPLTSAGSLDAFLVKYDADGDALWAQRGGGTGEDRGYGVATGADGTLFTTGYFSGTADFGARSLTSAGGFDVFLAGYSPDGDVAWAEHAGGTGSDIAYLMESEGTAAVLTGSFDGTASFGAHTLTSVGGTDLFVAWLDSKTVGVEAGPESAAEFVLSAGYPNPFDRQARLSLTARRTQPVTVTLLDVLGRPLRVLFDDVLPAHRHLDVVVDGGGLPGGLYLVRLTTADGIQQTARLTLAR